MFTSYSTDDQLLNPKEMITAIELMFHRMEMIDDICLHEPPEETVHVLVFPGE